ncbi:transglutaminase TgpA family protein [Salisediminibacterium beveridgei]|uniref:Transglutaminase-like enzyme, putative cysteine protease n=1 Tax=Salisediminibacterium beveridgei TaxID=632773 RepID=A0A1D7QYA4_9BACI|nr:transglutaminaseTgpA domain-containing protein [Salisediminibacterium beveridgei]AOM83981.1 Transglutaminase-like enzyme, putative cysteine protease [Salisediminibacterium beveridgei]
MSRQSKQSFSIVHLFIYVLAFLILWEWLRPIPAITDTSSLEVFLGFALVSAALIYIRLPIWVNLPVLAVAAVFGLHRIFYEGPFLAREGGGESIRMIGGEIRHNMGLLFSGDMEMLTNPFRTLLLFMLLALICYLMYFWVFQTRRVFFFLLATVVYITILDTFTVVDASQAIVRIVVIGFFMMTLLHMLDVQESEKEIGRKSETFLPVAWMYTLIAMVSIAIVVAFLMPKPEPQWSDPVPTIRGFVTGEGGFGGGSGGTVRRVGYGENDEQLGGGFIQDESVVFQAVTDNPVYWRGESKDEYTGRGWVNSETDYQPTGDVFDPEAIDYWMYDEDKTRDHEQTTATIQMSSGVGFSHLFYPGQLMDAPREEITANIDGDVIGTDALQFEVDTIGGRVDGREMGDDVLLEAYDITFLDFSFPIPTMEETEENDPDAIIDMYTQLPDDLPERVGELAVEITAEEDNRYDQAVAIEQYFGQNDFVYQTTDVPVPEDDEDYVDQFLFETQAGYCDNYSTSMVVLLRTLDIPARWVKGFTAGEELEQTEDDQFVYEVTNGNAHSWVEVYFPEVGWVPFEPTQGFENYADFSTEPVDIDLDLDGDDPDAPDPSDDLADDRFPDPDEGFDPGEAVGDGEGADGESSWRNWLTPGNILISIVVLFMVMLTYQKQSKLMNRFFFLLYKVSGTDRSFKNAYKRLLWLLEKEGLPRAEGETLREYARRVDQAVSSQAMMKLTKAYERMYYGGGDPKGEWQKHQKDWEEMLKRLYQ